MKLVKSLACLFIGGLFLTGCAETQFLAHTAKKFGGNDGPDPVYGEYKVGKPYQIYGTWYYPKEDYTYDETGIASWYGPNFHGKKTANGAIFDSNALTAAHRTLPMPSVVRVTNLENGRSLLLTVNDRGPFAKGRIIDISKRGAQLLGFKDNGTARVRVQIMERQSLALKNSSGHFEIHEVKKGEGPITVEAIPKETVKAESLPPPNGVSASPQPAVISNDKAPVSRIEPQFQTAPNDVSQVKVNLTERVDQEPVTTTRIFVQAGAFSLYENANRVKARLSGLGKVDISSVLVNGQDLFRVRVGPFSSVEEGDTMLSRIIDYGYPSARIIVDK